jgi:hypothetical protein
MPNRTAKIPLIKAIKSARKIWFSKIIPVFDKKKVLEFQTENF